MAVGRVGLLAQWTGSLTSLTDHFSRFAGTLVPRMVFDFTSPASAKATMESDGATPGRLFTVAGDRALHLYTGGVLDRIAPGSPVFGTIVAFNWIANNAWSNTVSVPFGGTFDGSTVAPVAVLQPLGEAGSTYDVRPKVKTAGDAYTPDITTSRAICVAEARSASGAAPTANMTRTCLLIAVRGQI